MKGVGGFTQRRVRHIERVDYYQGGRFSHIQGVGLVTEVIGLVQEGELVGHRSEGGCRLAGGSYSGGEAGDDPGRVGIPVLSGGTEENLVPQGSDHFAEFGDLPGDGDAVRCAVRVSGDREFAALGIEG
ncbi:hypothetical protein A6A29_32130 [Streptomyces sp. TSRI0281]|nr:hypothetical protein A6A29_32130 [Streptomyces sp. TSRI0281]